MVLLYINIEIKISVATFKKKTKKKWYERNILFDMFR